MAKDPQGVALVSSQEPASGLAGFCISRSSDMDRLTWIHYQMQLAADLIAEAQERGDKQALRRWMLVFNDVIKDKREADKQTHEC